MEHTPLPWMRNGQTTQDWWRIDGSGERTGFDFLAHPTAIVPDDADAEFIVRAVNNHDALLSALEEAHTALLSAILFIEGAFPERSDILKQELTSYRMREVKARVAILAAKSEA